MFTQEEREEKRKAYKRSLAIDYLTRMVPTNPARLIKDGKLIPEEDVFDDKLVMEMLEDVLGRLEIWRRSCTDRGYMIQALVPMLGEKGRAVYKMWTDKNVTRIHTDWVVDPMTLSGEDVAQLHLDMEEAAKNSEPFTINDDL